MREDPAHRPVGHLLREPRLKLLDRFGELRRDERAAALGVVDLPAAGGEHHDLEAEAELVLELEVGVPALGALLVGDHVGELGGGVEAGLVLVGRSGTLSMAMRAYSASWFLKLS